MQKLRSASNMEIYGGGVSEPDSLNDLSHTIGLYGRRTTSVSYGDGRRSTS